MASPRYGIWLIGARGGVSTSVTLGLAALQKGLIPPTGLVTALPQFGHLGLADWGELVIGGHEIRATTLRQEARQLHQQSRVFAEEVLAACGEDLDDADTRILPGILWNVGETIQSLATDTTHAELSPREAVEQVTSDLKQFREQNDLSDVVVVNVASTEPPNPTTEWPDTWDATQALLEESNCPLPASSLYAIAALDLGLPYINFTPSLGASTPGIDQLAQQRNTCHAGHDGKTGETLLKSVLAPMFAARNLQVMSWVGHNIFGNLDGKVLDNPINKAAKVQSKDHLLEKMLGYPPQTLVTIEHIQSMADWKTAWDHIHFQGFLQTPMTMQFTWQGCDSLLAAPLVLDLARFALEAHRRGETGVLTFLSAFFKSPLNTENQVFSDQMGQLISWADQDHS